MVATQPRITETVWRAQPRQRDFLRATEDMVLYGGAAGGGKTDSLLIDAIRTAVKHPGAKMLFLRRTYTHLAEPGAAIDRSQDLLRGTGPVYSISDTAWDFPGGSRIQFGHLDNDRALDNYQGSQPSRIYIDELTQFPEAYFWFLFARLRTDLDDLVPVIRAATNPGNIGHGWVKRLFIDAGPPNTPFTVERGGQTVTARFIPAKLEDNPALIAKNPGYEAKLNALPEDLRRAWRFGDWDVFAGQFFSEWRRDIHVCAPFAIPPTWPKWRAVDWGYGAPYACLWFARSPEQRIYVYREQYAAGVVDSQQAQRIANASVGEHIRFTVADPSMWNRQPNGISLAQVYAQYGVEMVPANNDRASGWQRVHEAMQWIKFPLPTLQVFSTCTDLIRTLPELVHDRVDVEDVAAGDDHLCLVGETMITTDEGAIPIAEIVPGCRVLTRAGYHRVLAAGRTANAAPVLSVTCSDGRTLTGTAAHPVWVESRGWVRLDKLRYGDIIKTWERRLTSWSSMASATVSTGVATTTAVAGMTLPVGITTCTLTSGRPSTERYHPVTTSITRTATRATTTHPILSALLRQTIELCTWTATVTIGHLPLLCARLLRGTPRRRASRGIASTGKRCGPILHLWSAIATCVAGCSRPRSGAASAFARTTVSHRRGAIHTLMTLPRSVPAVGRRFRPIDIADRSVVPVRVLSVSASPIHAPVYNLTVAGCPEFYANGILTHNCDCLRYGLAGAAVPSAEPVRIRFG